MSNGETALDRAAFIGLRDTAETVISGQRGFTGDGECALSFLSVRRCVIDGLKGAFVFDRDVAF